MGSSSLKGSIPIRYIRLKLRVTSKHFVNKNTKTPPIDRLTVTLIQKNFRSQVFWGSTKSISSSFTVFGKTEVSEFKISVTCDQEIFGFKISIKLEKGALKEPIDNVLRVEIFKHADDLRGKETSQVKRLIADILHSFVILKLSKISEISE